MSSLFPQEGMETIRQEVINTRMDRQVKRREQSHQADLWGRENK